MRTVVQRVSRAEVRVGGEVVGSIRHGLLALVGVERGDSEADADATARKLAALRCFPGRTPMDQTLLQVGGDCLVVSQFTLLAELARGNRPGLDRAEAPERAQALYERLCAALSGAGVTVATGRFGAMMEVELVNDGPVTLILRIRDGRVVDPG